MKENEKVILFTIPDCHKCKNLKMQLTNAKIDFELLQQITNRITNEVKGVNRVVFDLTPKPSGTIEWE